MSGGISCNAAHGLPVAIVGLGRMGTRHIQAVQRLGMRVVGLADVSRDAVDLACSDCGIDPSGGFTDALEMLRRVRPVAVVVSTTAPSHSEIVSWAAEAGARFILAEKPMACSLADADRMVEICASKGARLAINHQMAFMAQYTEVRSLIGTPEMGPLASMVVSGSNFGLAMNAGHYFEAFRFLAEEEVESVCGWLEPDSLPNPRGREFKDSSGRVLARTASGVCLYVDFSSSAGWGVQVNYVCRNGQMHVDELRGRMSLAFREAEYRSLPTTRYGMPVNSQEREIQPADTVGPTMSVWAALLEGRQYPDGRAGRHSLACLVAAHESNERGGMAVRLRDLSGEAHQRVFPWA
jgi:predicted dehydrogenase